MLGAMRLANDVAWLLLAWNGVIAYVFGGASLILGAYMLFQAAQRGHRLYGRHVAALGVMLAGTLFLGFPNLLNLSTASIGGSAQAGVSTGGLTAYSSVAPDGVAWLRGTWREVLLAVTGSFMLFFRALGATFAISAIIAFRAVQRGSSQHTYKEIIVRFWAGILTMNINNIAEALFDSANAGS